jgi:predicted MFS family arabinose efflux permease
MTTAPSSAPVSYRPLYFLALGTFAIGTESFMIAALLPGMAADLGVTLSMAGQLVTAFTLVYALSSPVLTALTGSIGRRKLLLATMSLFALGNIVAAMAASYWALLFARVMLALAAGLYAPNANALAGALLPPERRGRALAIVSGGFSVAVALGVPTGAFIGNHLGWRVTFVAVAVLALAATVGLLLGVPKDAGKSLSTATLAERIAVIRQPGTLPALFVTTLWALGCYTVYTFIAPLLAGIASLDGSHIGYILFCWGACAIVGISIGGFANDKIGARSVILIALPLLAVSLLGFSVAMYVEPGARMTTLLVAVVVWGLSAWAFTPAQQARLIGMAGLKNAPIVLSLNASFQYFGFSLGAVLGALTLSIGGVGSLGWVGGLCVLGAIGLFVSTGRRTSLMHRRLVASEL